MKPVLYSILVKNGTKNIQKARLYTVLIIERGCKNPCFAEKYLAGLARIHANRMVVWHSITSQNNAPKIASPINPFL